MVIRHGFPNGDEIDLPYAAQVEDAIGWERYIKDV